MDTVETVPDFLHNDHATRNDTILREAVGFYKKKYETGLSTVFEIILTFSSLQLLCLERHYKN